MSDKEVMEHIARVYRQLQATEPAPDDRAVILLREAEELLAQHAQSAIPPSNQAVQQMSEPCKTAQHPGDEAPAAAPLIDELTEALTATGNYLAAATRMLEAEADPPGETVQGVLRNSLAQFSRATEALRRLRDAHMRAGSSEPCHSSADG